MSEIPPVFVAGMHRGGTSAVAQVLVALGLDSGPAERLIGATEANRHGHFEVEEITSLNENMLRELGGSWLSPPPGEEAVAELANTHFAGQSTEALSRQFSKKPWFLKDPRLSLLLPFWSQILSESPLVIVVVRSPQAIAQSLHARDGLPLEYGLLLAGSYLNTVSRDAKDLPNLVVHYEELLRNPKDSVEAMVKFLNGHGLSLSQDVKKAVALLDQSDNHQVVTGQDQEATLLSWHGRPLQDNPLLPSLNGDKAGLSPILAEKMQLVGHYLGVASERELRMVTLAEELGDVQGALVDRQSDVTALSEQIATLKDEVGHWQGVASERELDVSGLLVERDGALVERERALAEVEAIRAHRAAEIASTTYQLAALMTRVGARMAPSATRRRATFSVFLRKGRKGYSYIRKVGRGKPTENTVVELPELLQGELPAPIHFINSKTPKVSIVIPVYGQLAVTAQCLKSIAGAKNELSYEVVVVNDQSPDQTAEFLATCSGLKVVTNTENLGYLRSTNRGAEAASGEFIILLNNDTEVSDGWIDNLIATFDRYPDTGVVGAKLVYPDGRLQEAGAVIFNDGTGWNYGRFQNPSADEFAFLREVDYCSAACVAVRRDLWNELNGFDERFAPAYYEDTDLAFSARSLGYKVRYQPKVQVVHHEGVSHGTDESSGLKAHQKINHEVFVNKWAMELKKQLPSGAQSVLRASSRRLAGKILVADYEVPHWDKHSGGLRMSRILGILAELGWQVTFAPGNAAPIEPYTSELRQQGIEVVCFESSPEEYLKQKGKEAFDVALLSRPEDGARWLSAFRSLSPATRVIYDTVDLHVVRMKRGRDLGRNDLSPKMEEQIADLERQLINAADLTLVVSEEEKSWLTAEMPKAKVVVIGNVHAEELSEPPFENREGILFVGSWNHHPNQDAIEFLIEEIAPLLWEKIPDLPINIVGSGLPKNLGKGDNRIIRHGWIEDLAAIYGEAVMTVAPLRYGAGLKGKVGGSLCRGVPMVGTPVAFEGYGFGDDQEIIQADCAVEIAKSILNVYSNKKVWEGLRERGRILVLETLGTQQITADLRGALDSLTALDEDS